MRSKNNIKKFPHVSKTRSEKEKYVDDLVGTKNDYDRVNFDDTDIKAETLEFEDIDSEPSESYKSTKTIINQFLKKHLLTIFTVILTPVSLWFLYTIIGYGNDIAALKENKEHVSVNLIELKDKYENLNESTIKTEVMIDEIRKDLDNLIYINKQ